MLYFVQCACFILFYFIMCVCVCVAKYIKFETLNIIIKKYIKIIVLKMLKRLYYQSIFHGFTLYYCILVNVILVPKFQVEECRRIKTKFKKTSS